MSLPSASGCIPQASAAAAAPLLPPADLRAPGQPMILLYGHFDVQPPGPAARWSRPPFDGALAGGRIHGRGASDDKGPLVALLAGLECHLAATARLNLRLVPGQRPAEVATLVARHLRRTEPGADHRLMLLASAPPVVLPEDHPLLRAADRALRATWGAPPVHARSGGTVPAVAELHRRYAIPAATSTRSCWPSTAPERAS